MQTYDFIIIGAGSAGCVPIRIIDAELIADIRARARTLFPPTGTCRMRAARADIILSDHAGD
ncbi:hypothetical protein [Hoeflea sp.]|uniref:hypothetical protein n=1 Tax=Hoeflea sp. TaxID=1940281 RepID=UPI003748EC61